MFRRPPRPLFWRAGYTTSWSYFAWEVAPAFWPTARPLPKTGKILDPLFHGLDRDGFG